MIDIWLVYYNELLQAISLVVLVCIYIFCKTLFHELDNKTISIFVMD